MDVRVQWRGVRIALLVLVAWSSCSFGENTNTVMVTAPRIIADGTVCLSLADAINTLRKVPSCGQRRIVLSAGKYFLDESVVLDERDNNLMIEAFPRAEVELIGGIQITGWRSEGKFWVADVLGTKDRRRDFRMLLVNGRYAARARYPETGRLQHESIFKPRWLSTEAGGWERKPTESELTTLQYKTCDLGPWLNPDNAEITVYHMWDETLVGVKSMDLENRIITFLNPAGHPPGGFGIKDYVVWNVKEGMTKPGQWYLDRTNEKLVYWPLPDEKITETEIIAPLLERIIKIEGKAGVARNISLKGLTLKAANTALITGGFGAKQFDGAVSVNNAESCRFEDLEITGVTGWGMKLVGDQFEIINCRIHHTGAGGINLYSAGAVVENNEIDHIGLTYPSAIALCVGSTDPHGDDWQTGKGRTGVTVSHNKIHDTPYTGMSCGGAGHIIEYNLIYRTMQELADGSGMYITFCRDLVLRNNVVRDIPDAAHSGSSAYYLDELTSNALVENNISIGVSRPLHCHMAENNRFINNIFSANGSARITLPKCTNMRFEKNIMIAHGPIRIGNPDAITQFVGNFLFSSTGQIYENVMQDYKVVNQRIFNEPDGNHFSDPGLSIGTTGDITFNTGSPAEKSGIHPISGSQAGPRSAR